MEIHRAENVGYRKIHCQTWYTRPFHMRMLQRSGWNVARQLGKMRRWNDTLTSIQKPGISISKNEHFSMCVCTCGYVWKGESAPWGLKIWKKYPKNAESWIMEGRFSERPDREHGNPLKPVRTRDDVDKNFSNAIVAGFRRIFPTLRGQFPSNPSIFGESTDMTSRPNPHRRILYNLASSSYRSRAASFASCKQSWG